MQQPALPKYQKLTFKEVVLVFLIGFLLIAVKVLQFKLEQDRTIALFIARHFRTIFSDVDPETLQQVSTYFINYAPYIAGFAAIAWVLKKELTPVNGSIDNDNCGSPFEEPKNASAQEIPPQNAVERFLAIIENAHQLRKKHRVYILAIGLTIGAYIYHHVLHDDHTTSLEAQSGIVEANQKSTNP